MSCIRIVVTSLLGCWVVGCAGLAYVGSAHDLAPEAMREEPGWVGVPEVPLYRQQGEHDCGPTALAMVLRYWDADFPVQRLLEWPENVRVSAGQLRSLARDAGFSAFVIEGTVEDIVHEVKAGRPVIAGVTKPTAMGHVAHYEVVVGFHPESQRIATLDPAEGWRANSYGGFLEEWLPTGRVLLVVLPTAAEPAKRDGARASREEAAP